MSDNPRRLFGFGGGIAVGEQADLAVLDLETTYTINPDDFRSKGKATPFAGQAVRCKAIQTWVDGALVYDETTKQ